MQTLRRVMVTLTLAEKDALLALARRERRDPRDQAALMISQTLKQLGLLEKNRMEEIPHEQTQPTP